MGNPGGGSIFGLTPEQERLFAAKANPTPGLIPTPAPLPPIPAPPPAPVVPPIASPTTKVEGPSGVVSSIIGGGTVPKSETLVSPGPVSGILGGGGGSSVPAQPIKPVEGMTGGNMAQATGTVATPSWQQLPGSQGIVSETLKPLGVEGGGPKEMSQEEWKDKYRQEADKRQLTGPVSESINKTPAAIPGVTPTPVTPAPTTPTPAITPTAPVPTPTAPQKRAVETDPYERWKQLGRPGGSFDAWKKSQGL